MVTEAAAVAIALQQFDVALEWLEQGRSVVWGQTLQLRTPYDDLHATQPKLAEQLQAVSHQLEALSTSEPVQPVFDHAPASLHAISWKHRRLADEREELLSQVRLLPGFEGFLRPPKVATLSKLVQDGIVVIVNVFKNTCDALVIRSGTEAITHVHLPEFSVEKAGHARVNIASFLRGGSSHRGIKKHRHQFSFKDILAMLWHNLVKPVLNHLQISEVLPAESLPHITWCTTGPLAFLPIHAAGDYRSPNTVLSNLAISSYTPTISSLSQHTSSSDSFSGILAVGHESSVRGLSKLPGTKDELRQVQDHAGGLPFTQLDEENALTDTVLKAMEDHSWVHFACHASQNKTDPMKSAFHLHDGDLDLATISRKPLKKAQLAFLSACQTATGDDVLPDESIHLAAGLLMAGYSTVIATMWSIDDRDAPLVAEKVYECLLEGGKPNSQKAALALHKAVASLRATIGVDEFARWVPYIHIGR
ncbi:hypothetical protein FS749_002547 [Ceratobasidium sp. UAMH 11750]|nr:hypothetical protein FS749_002547 [Ceratobasidium sp. UAMH 11750]